MPNCQFCDGVIKEGVCLNCGQLASPQSEQRLTDSSEPQRTRRHAIPVKLILAIAMAVILIVAVTLLTLVLIKEGEAKGVTYEMIEYNRARIEYIGELTGSEASQVRSEIDSFGNGDGVISSTEVRIYEDFHEHLFEGNFVATFTIDDIPGLSHDCQISFRVADKDVNSEDAISARFTYNIEWSSLVVGKNSYISQIPVYSYEGENFRFSAPPSYKVISVGGLVDVIYSDDSTKVSGTIEESYVYVTTIKIDGDELGDYEPNNTFSTACPILNGTVIQGSLNSVPDMEDFYYIYLNSNDTIDITLDGQDNTDFDLFFYKNSLHLEDSSTNNDSDERIVCQVSSSGLYFINISANIHQGDYTLSIHVS